MAKSLDALIDFLLDEIALSGDRGLRFLDIVKSTRKFYSITNSLTQPYINRSGASDPLKLTHLPLLDLKFFEKVLKWLARHPDVSVGTRHEYDQVSLSQLERQFPGYSTLEDQHVISTAIEAGLSSIETGQPSSTGVKGTGSADATTIGPRHGPRIYVSQDRMFLAICEHLPDPTRVFPSEWTLLVCVAQTRDEGILQGELGRLTGQDKRSVPARTDKLHKKGYVVKKTVFVKGIKTSRIYLRRFSPDNVPNVGQPSTHTVKHHASRLFVVLGSNPLIPQDDLLDALELKTQDQMKIFSQIIRHFSRIGCIKRTRTAFGPSSQAGDLKMCIQYLREPSAEDWFDAEGNIDFDELVDGPPRLVIRQEPIDAVADSFAPNMPPLNHLNMPKRAELHRTLPQWNPDRLLANVLFDAARISGIGGMTNVGARLLITGLFVRRVLESFLIKISHQSLQAQPPGLRHLCIVRSKKPTDSNTQYVHHTYELYHSKVQNGEAKWEDVENSSRFPRQILERTEAASQIEKYARDSFGFPVHPKRDSHSCSALMSRSDLVSKASIVDVHLLAGEPILPKVMQSSPGTSSVRGDTSDNVQTTLSDHGRQFSKKDKNDSGDLSNIYPGRASKRDSAGKTIIGRPRKFAPGTEKFWRDMFAAVVRGNAPSHARNTYVAGLMKNPVALGIFQSRPHDFDETLVAAIEAGLPIPRDPSNITSEWTANTQAALKLDTDGLYLTHTGHTRRSRLAVSKIMIVKNCRLQELDFADRHKTWAWQYFSSSAAHSHIYRRFYPRLGMTPREITDSLLVSEDSRDIWGFKKQQRQEEPSQELSSTDTPNLQSVPPRSPLRHTGSSAMDHTPADVCSKSVESQVENSPSFKAVMALPNTELSGLSVTTPQLSASKCAGEDEATSPNSASPTQKTMSTQTVNKISHEEPNTAVLTSPVKIYEIQSAVEIDSVNGLNSHVFNKGDEIVAMDADVAALPIVAEVPDQRSEDLQPHSHTNAPPEYLVETASLEAEGVVSKTTLEEQVTVEPPTTPGLQADLDMNNIDPRILGPEFSTTFGLVPAENLATFQAANSPTSQLGSEIPNQTTYPILPQSSRKRKISVHDTSPGPSEVTRPAKYAKLITSNSEAGRICRNIILDLINLCSGLAPSDAWTFRRAMTTRWLESGVDVEQPTAKLVRSHLKQLGSGSTFKQITFAFRGNSGSMVSKSIIALRTISSLSPELLELQRKMKEADPEDYVPPELLAEFYRTPADQPRREAGLQAKNDDLFTDLANQPLSPGSPAQDAHSPSSKPPSITMGFLTLKVPNLRTLSLPASYENSHIPPRRPLSPPKKRGRPPRKQHKRGGAGHNIVWTNQKQTLPKSINDIPNMISSRGRAASVHGPDTYVRFTAEIECVVEWETNSSLLLGQPLSRPHFLNFGIDAKEAPQTLQSFPALQFKSIISFDSDGHEHETSFPEEQSWPPFTDVITPALLSRPLDLSTSEKPVLKAGTLSTKRKRQDSVRTPIPRKRRRRTLPVSSIGLRGTARVTLEDTASRVKDRKYRRQGQRIRYMSEETQYQVVITCIIVRTLAGGIDKFIDWTLVRRLIPEHDEEFLQSAWKSLLGRYRSDVAGLTECLQDRYLDALVNGEVPTINFDDLHATNWEGIREWSLVNLEKFTIKKVDDLPTSKAAFLRRNDITVSEPAGVRDMLGYCVLTAQPKKEEIMGGLVFGTALKDPSTRGLSKLKADSAISLARTWIISILMTSEEDYNPSKVHTKLLKLSADPVEGEAILEQALKSLQHDKSITRFRNTARLAPSLADMYEVVGVRSWQVSTKYYESIDTRRHITGSLLRKSHQYKVEVLDTAFARGCNVIVPKDSTLDDSAMIAILNLMASSAIRVRAGDDKPDTRYGLDHESVAYTTKHINKKSLAFSIVIEQSPHGYVQGDPLKDHRRGLSAPRGEIDDPTDRGRIPPWFDINYTFLPKIWEIFLGAVVGLISIRPGMDLAELTKNFNGVTGEWEVGLVVDYLSELKAIRRSRLGGGWETEVWWWMCIAGNASSLDAGASVGVDGAAIVDPDLMQTT